MYQLCCDQLQHWALTINCKMLIPTYTFRNVQISYPCEVEKEFYLDN